jgi:hypothetical protein
MSKREVWPAILKEKDAEKQDLIVHVHFDAKYKVTQFQIQTSTDKDLIEQEENNERKGIYKNADLLKMHAYKDAIRRSGGAYVLYPGTEKKEIRGFHEIIPGLGAFSVNPTGQTNDISELSKFIDLVIDHLLDRASQRENVSHKTHQIYQIDKEDDNILHEPIPEYFNGEKLIPDETIVIVGFYKSADQLKWINKEGLYNFRTGTNNGSIPLNTENINAKYLVLHGENELNTNKIYQLSSEGPKIFSKKDMKSKKYPNPSGELYLIYKIIKDVSTDYNNIMFDLREIPNFETGRQSAKPFTTTLTTLLKSKDKK